MESLIWSFAVTIFLQGKPIAKSVHYFDSRAGCRVSYIATMTTTTKFNRLAKEGDKFEVTKCTRVQEV